MSEIDELNKVTTLLDELKETHHEVKLVFLDSNGCFLKSVELKLSDSNCPLCNMMNLKCNNSLDLQQNEKNLEKST